MKNIIWTTINFLLVSVPILWHSNYSFLFIIISALSIPFLYNKFLISLEKFINKEISFKTIISEYINIEHFTYNNLKIFLGVIFSVQPLSVAIIYNYNLYYSIPLYLISILSFMGFYKTIHSIDYEKQSLIMKK